MEEEYENIRSEEVQEILGTPPPWLVQWGTILIFIVLGLLTLVSWLVKYPNTIKADITLTTLRPPVPVFAQSDGYIESLLVADSDSVSTGDVLAIIANPAEYQDVLKLEKDLQQIQGFDQEALLSYQPDGDLELGELQTDYTSFVQLFQDFSFTQNTDTEYDKKSIRRLKDQIRNIQSGIRALENEKIRAEENRDLARKQYELLHTQYSGEVEELEKLQEARQHLLEREQDISRIEAQVSEKNQEISNLRVQILAVQQGYRAGNMSKYQSLRQSVTSLRGEVEEWKQQYLLSAPTSGQVTFYQLPKEQTYVNNGDRVMAIVPYQKGNNLIGEILLPVEASGQVGNGQKVIIQLNGYPYEEYGHVLGSVQNKALLPQDGEYYIRVDLENGLQTNLGEQIDFRQQMQGEARIITEEKRFLERLLERLFGVFQSI
jgi:multidrug efflux pump subunit AcrA (membrane-fusion protein)